MRFLKIVLLILFIAFIIVFVQQNTETLNQAVQFRLEDPVFFKQVWATNSAPLLLVLVLSFMVGGLIATLYLFLDKMRLGRLTAMQRVQVATLEREVADLKAQLERERAVSMPATITPVIVTETPKTEG